MGDIIQFADFKLFRPQAREPQFGVACNHEQETIDAIHAAAGQREVLAAARPILELCRDRYGFAVMRNGLPPEPAILGCALLELFRGLSMLDSEMGAPRTYPTFGVYFGRRQLAWFEDGYSGTTGLALPNDITASNFVAFVRPRIVVARSRSLE